MPSDLISRYLWLVDTIRTYERITREDIDRLWRRSALSDGRSMPRRTFLNYRTAAEKLFNITIACDPSTYEYYIEGDPADENVNEWLLNTAATQQILSESRDVADKIIVDSVPSAREFLAPVIEALRENRRIRFDYHPYHRTIFTPGIYFEPYCLKLFRQRWYMIGRHVEQGRIKTYALDRISNLRLTPKTFTPAYGFNAAEYFEGAFGIVVNSAPIEEVVIRTDSRQAKYFRALPLHQSQYEYIHDEFSEFHYRLRVTPDLIQELLSYGSRIEVISPIHLRFSMADALRDALDKYE